MSEKTVKVKCLRGCICAGEALKKGKSYDISPRDYKILAGKGKVEKVGGAKSKAAEKSEDK